jgi:hypothetical protein
MKRFYTTLFISLGMLYGCSIGPKNLDDFMVDISEFKINNEILKDGDYVEILGSSGNLTKEHEIEFYNLVVVRSLETGDTVNVLVTTFYEADLNNPKTRFMSNSSLVGKLFENTSNLEDLTGENINKLKPKSYKKVFYDSEYIQIDVREYPAITGTLGDFTIDGNIEEIGI